MGLKKAEQWARMVGICWLNQPTLFDIKYLPFGMRQRQFFVVKITTLFEQIKSTQSKMLLKIEFCN